MSEGEPKHGQQPVASDMEAAEFWSKHLAAPCNPGPGQEHLHVGSTYLREARKELIKMQSKPDSERDDAAIQLLQAAVDNYITLNGDK